MLSIINLISRLTTFLLAYLLQIINAGEGVEKKEHSFTGGGNVNWYRHYGRQYGDSFKKN